MYLYTILSSSVFSLFILSEIISNFESSYQHRNIRLTGHILKTYRTRSRLLCISDCNRVMECLSVNYIKQQDNTQICEFNSLRIEDATSSSAMHDPNSVYVAITHRQIYVI